MFQNHYEVYYLISLKNYIDIQNKKQNERKRHYPQQKQTEKWTTETFIDLKQKVITNKKLSK